MRLIARRAFRNPGTIEVKGAKHPLHIPKGVIFDIGDKPDFKSCSKEDRALIDKLNHAECIGDATRPEVVAQIQKEVAEEEATAARQAATPEMEGLTPPPFRRR